MAAGEARAAGQLKLPRLKHASIRVEKISAYLLSPTHPVGRHKARFFESFGFARSSADVLMAALIEHARVNEVTVVEESRFGRRYTVDGPLQSPDGRSPSVRVIWFAEAEGGGLQFVTAYPLPKAKT